MIDQALARFIVEEALPGTDVDADGFLAALSAIVHDIGPRNRALLRKRDAFQAQLDAWYLEHGGPGEPAAYEAFLRQIGYIVPEGGAFAVTTANVDPEITTIAGPQLVVPISNGRFALNAANARWGSLYDALYGTDALSEEDGAARTRDFNPVRGRKVIDWARDFLDRVAPLTLLAWADDISATPGTRVAPQGWPNKGLQVWANADYPADARRARSYGAVGIGLCRTEHMFFEQVRNRYRDA